MDMICHTLLKTTTSRARFWRVETSSLTLLNTSYSVPLMSVKYLYDFVMLHLFPRMLTCTNLSGDLAGLEVEWSDRGGSLSWREWIETFFLGYTQLLLGVHLKSVQNIGKILGF
jgi:hypothetical protein